MVCKVTVMFGFVECFTSVLFYFEGLPCLLTLPYVLGVLTLVPLIVSATPIIVITCAQSPHSHKVQYTGYLGPFHCIFSPLNFV